MKKQSINATIASALIVCGATFGQACGGTETTVKAPSTSGGGMVDDDGNKINKETQNKYNEALDVLTKSDATNNWTEATCQEVAKKFEAANDAQGGLARARYNAGIAMQRCKKHKEARAIFEEILSKDEKFHRARVQVALYKFHESGEKDIDAAIGEMKRAIKDAEFKNVEALVNLAMLQMRRDSDQGEGSCDNDFACAKLNLQRALAINDSFMPAFNQLAVYYFTAALKKAGRTVGDKLGAASAKKKKADSAALELAQLVCSQAIRKNPRYAPIYNTTGLISSELGDLSAAAQAFGKARALDKDFFEAQMNYAAVNLSFRGFKKAEEAYRAAINLRPKDYEAHLGLALAIRGQINDVNFDKNLKAAEDELNKAKAIDANRPETYYNMAILTQEFKARSAGGKNNEPVMLAAKALFKQFREKVGAECKYRKRRGKVPGGWECTAKNPAFAHAATTAQEREEEIQQIIDFNRQTAADQKAMKEAQERAAAKAALEKKNGKPAPAPATP